MKIRLATDQDYAAIARLHRQTIRQVNAKDYTPEQIKAWSARPSAKRLRDSAKEYKRWVATVNGKVIGYCDHDYEGNFAGLYMHKDYIGQGIGSCLLKTAEDSMKKLGFKKSKLTATITAKQFYQKQGYKVLAKSLHAMGDQLLEVYIMTKPLSPEQYLTDHQITFIAHEHAAVFTCEEAEKHCANVPGIPGKNLFLRDKKGQRHFLVILPASKRANLKAISEIVSESKVSFASPEVLMDKLGLEPGAVSPFGLLNDHNHQIEVYIDAEIYKAPLVNFHPNRNTASLELTGEMFHKYLETLPNTINIIQIL